MFMPKVIHRIIRKLRTRKMACQNFTENSRLLAFQKEMLAKECRELETAILYGKTRFRFLSVEERCKRIDFLQQMEINALPEILKDHLIMISPVNQYGRIALFAYTSDEIDSELHRLQYEVKP